MQAGLASREFWTLLDAGSQEAQAHGIRDVRGGFEHALMRMGSHRLAMPGMTIVRGWSVAGQDLASERASAQPSVVLHLGLRGAAAIRMEGLPDAIGDRPGFADLVFSPPGTSRLTFRARRTNEAFRVNLTPAYFTALAERYPDLARDAEARLGEDRPAAALTPPRALPMARVLDLIDDVMNSDDYGDLRRSFIEARIVELLIRQLRTQAPAPPRLRNVDRMVEVRDRLLARISDPPTLADLARATGTNELALKRDFKAVFGKPVYAFLLDERLERARQLLLDTDRPIKEIAGQVGYTHTTHFSAAFRKRYGSTPGSLRA